jgi:hypothetical protein
VRIAVKDAQVNQRTVDILARVLEEHNTGGPDG